MLCVPSLHALPSPARRQLTFRPARSQTGTAKIRNAFGGAETVEGNVSFGTRTKSAFQVRRPFMHCVAAVVRR